MTAKSSAISRAAKTSRKAATSKAAAAKSKTGKLPEWNLDDLYSGIDAPEVARDLSKMDADCIAFETDYKGKLAEFTARDDGGSWLAEAVKRYEAIDDLAGRLGSSRKAAQKLAHSRSFWIEISTRAPSLVPNAP